MKTLKDLDLNKYKKILVRCDFNVGLTKEGEISDDFRIKRAMLTINYLSESKAIVILMSHLEKKEKLVSLRIVAERLERLLEKKIRFAPDCIGPACASEIKKMKPGDILLLENLRFHDEEKANDDGYAKKIAALGDAYVNEAFSCSHRAHASIVGVPKYLPAFAGFLLENEVTNLKKILTNPERPFVVVLGGIKVEIKVKTILNILKTADHLLFGSKIGETILIQKQILLGRETTTKEKMIEQIDLTSPKIHLPVDGVMALKDLSEGYLRKGAIGTLRHEEEIYDIGPETIKFFREIIKSAKTIFFSGPMGMFENRDFGVGTREIIDAITKNHQAFKVAGGGETLEAINKAGVSESFDFLSTGGGSMLEFLAGDELPGIEALR